MNEIVLVIDDELPERDPLRLKIRELLEPKGFNVEFFLSGEDGIQRVKEDVGNKIKIILLDIVFKNQPLQGTEIFLEIKNMHPNLPIIMLSKIPVREDKFKKFMELGAEFYIEKRDFTRRGTEQMNYIETLVRNPQNIGFTLIYKPGLDRNKNEITDIDIIKQEGSSILKRMKRVTDLSGFLEICIEKRGEYISKDEDPFFREMDLVEFYKSVHKLNESICKSSGGRIPRILEGGGPPRSRRLVIDKVKKLE